MRTRIADDPDSWGKPADLEERKKPIEICAEDFDRIVAEHNLPARPTKLIVEANARYQNRLNAQSGYSLCPHCGAIPNHETQDLCPMSAA